MNLLIFKNWKERRASTFRHTRCVPFVASILMCVVGLGITAHAQTLTHNDQAKVNRLKARYQKASHALDQTTSVLGRYRVFQVFGKVQAGDTNSARVYGRAVGINSTTGPGWITDDNFLEIKNPVADNYKADNYVGYCTFAGAPDGINVYIPVERQPDYLAAVESATKWKAITSSIEAEINTVYLPYQRKAAVQEAKQQRLAQEQAERQAAKQRHLEEARAELAQAQQEKNEALATQEATHQQRVNEAQNDLTQAQEKEQSPVPQPEAQSPQLGRDQTDNADQTADDDVARIKAQTEAAKAEKARIEAETKKQNQEAAEAKAKELEEADAKNQAAITQLQSTPTIVPGEQLGQVHLGMTEAQVLRLMGLPAIDEQLLKPATTDLVGAVPFRMSKIRRSRYLLDAVPGLDVAYEGSEEELSLVAHRMGIQDIKRDDPKIKFVFDVFYINDKVVQLQSDSPQFFTADKKNILDTFSFEKPYKQAVDTWIVTRTDQGDFVGQPIGWYSYYKGSWEKGLSLRVDPVVGGYRPSEKNLPSPFPPSRTTVVVHRPKTVPFTDSEQAGISLLNRNAGDTSQYDADNIEERGNPRNWYGPKSTAEQVADTVAPGVTNPGSLKEKVKRKIGGLLPHF